MTAIQCMLNIFLLCHINLISTSCRFVRTKLQQKASTVPYSMAVNHLHSTLSSYAVTNVNDLNTFLFAAVA